MTIGNLGVQSEYTGETIKAHHPLIERLKQQHPERGDLLPLAIETLRFPLQIRQFFIEYMLLNDDPRKKLTTEQVVIAAWEDINHALRKHHYESGDDRVMERWRRTIFRPVSPGRSYIEYQWVAEL